MLFRSVHAEFLVIVSVGSHSIVSFGLWRRHSDFHKLAAKVTSALTEKKDLHCVINFLSSSD